MHRTGPLILGTVRGDELEIEPRGERRPRTGDDHGARIAGKEIVERLVRLHDDLDLQRVHGRAVEAQDGHGTVAINVYELSVHVGLQPTVVGGVSSRAARRHGPPTTRRRQTA